jgi:phenylacetate-coenzyme A ligase PaaK-like adenylate-forming protein
LGSPVSELNSPPDVAPGANDLELSLAQAVAGREAWRERDTIISRKDGRSAFIRHVLDNIPRYRALAASVRSSAGHRDEVSLDQFPIVSRSDVASDRLGFLSARAETADAPLVAKTSGSTGRPLTVRFGQAEWYELNQASYARIARNLPELEPVIRPGQLSVAMIHEGPNRQNTQTILLEMNCSVFARFVLRGETSNDQGVVNALRAMPPPILYGKAKYLLRLADLDAAMVPRQTAIKPGAILVSGENLYRDQRNALERAYGCRVINAYTSVEGGLIGLECPLGGGLHVDGSRTELEILRADGVVDLAGDGEFVVTNFWNWTMPFVRYRTGDFGEVRRQTCRCGHSGATIARLDGREVGIFECASDRTATSNLDDVFSGIGIKEFQIDQVGPDSFELHWVAGSAAVDPESQERQMVARLATHLGKAVVRAHQHASLSGLRAKGRRYVSTWRGRAATQPAAFAPKKVSMPAGARSLAVSPDARLAAVAVDRSVQIWDLRQVVNIQSMPGGDRIARARFSPTDGILAWGDRRGDVAMFGTAAEGRRISSIAAGHPVADVCFSFDGEILVGGGADGWLGCWSVADASLLRQVQAHAGAVTAIAASPIARLIASADRTGAGDLQVRSVPDFELMAQLPAAAGVLSLDFMVDEHILAVGLANGCVEVWNLETLTRIVAFQHSGPVTAVAFAQSAQLLVAGNQAGAIKAWHVWRSTEAFAVQAHAGAVQGFAFLSEGDGFVSIGADSSVNFWPLS